MKSTSSQTQFVIRASVTPKPGLYRLTRGELVFNQPCKKILVVESP